MRRDGAAVSLSNGPVVVSGATSTAALTGLTRARFGVSFSYPVAQARSITWLGHGPYRVYKNRLRGVTDGVWSKDDNDTATRAKLWEYPEFKGYHADLSWAVLHTGERDITVVSEQDDLYLRLFTPSVGVDPRFATVPYPAGDLSFLDAIPAIGDKFITPEDHGPRSAPAVAAGTYERTLYFRFGG